jgi:hypothetical protein
MPCYIKVVPDKKKKKARRAKRDKRDDYYSENWDDLNE